MRFYGSNSSIFSIRLRQSSLAWGTISRWLPLLIFPNNLNTSWPALSLRLLISCSVGGPVQLSTFYSWLKVDVPAKRGRPRCISAKRHPILHTSMARVYLREPTKISGALYHRVAIYSVSASTGYSTTSSKDLTNPKSQSFASQLSLTSTFEGLRSLCISPAEWR